MEKKNHQKNSTSKLDIKIKEFDYEQGIQKNK